MPPKKAEAKAEAKPEDPEDDDEDNVNIPTLTLEEHKAKLLSSAGKSPEIISFLVSDTPADFKSKWPKNQSGFSGQQWEAAKEIFVNSSDWVRKDQNVYLNEIRERALLFIVNLTDTQIAAFRIDESIKQFLKQLRDIWIGRICDCRDTFILYNYTEDNPDIEQYLSQYNDTTFNRLVRKGGRSSRWDFELNDTDNPRHSVKIELKFSSTGKTGVDELAQFVAVNLEGKVALDIFGGSYLDFFDSGGFLKAMVDMCNRMCGVGTLTIPSVINDWKKTAAATDPSKSTGDTKQFFETLRRINKNKKDHPRFIEAKKELVNESFGQFIRFRLDYLNGHGMSPLQELLNTQVDKYFCIFTSKDENTVDCNVDKMPEFTIKRIVQGPEQHKFTIITSDEDEYNILVGLSWGNGGAGINNPRAMFKLYKKGTSGGSGKILRGGSGEIELPEDDPENEIEDEILDEIDNVSIQSKKPIIRKTKLKNKIDKLKVIASFKHQPVGMVLKSGTIKPDEVSKWEKNEETGVWEDTSKSDTEGGKKHPDRIIYSKTNSVKSKRGKNKKLTRKPRKKTYKNKKTRRR
jgi:hypothetical protein